jgi:hypothetical protein
VEVEDDERLKLPLLVRESRERRENYVFIDNENERYKTKSHPSMEVWRGIYSHTYTSLYNNDVSSTCVLGLHDKFCNPVNVVTFNC